MGQNNEHQFYSIVQINWERVIRSMETELTVTQVFVGTFWLLATFPRKRTFFEQDGISFSHCHRNPPEITATENLPAIFKNRLRNVSESYKDLH